MKFENTDILLIIIFRKRDKKDQVTFRQLETFLTQEKSQISHDLKKLEQRKLITKANGYVRFKEFAITKEGITKAKKLIEKMKRIVAGA